MINNLTSKHLFFDDMWENSNNSVLIAMQGITNDLSNSDLNKDVFSNEANKPFQFFTNGAINLSGSNQYEAPLENAFNELKRYVGIFNALTSETNDLKGIPAFQIRTELQTVMQWVSSDRKSFNIPVFFTKWKKSHSTMEYIRKLERATAPNKVQGVAGDFIQVGPGSKASFNKSADGKSGTVTSNSGGLCALKIGNWFLADQLVFTNYQMTLSQETDPKGEPLFIEGSVTLTARKIFDAETVARWYITPKDLF
jgi:hypothetical protein